MSRCVVRTLAMCGLVVSGLIGLPAIATAAAPAPWYIGAQINTLSPDGGRNASAGTGWGLLMGHSFGAYALELYGGYHADRPRNAAALANWTTVGINGLWYFAGRQFHSFLPFAQAGAGSMSEYSGTDQRTRSHYGAVGAGFYWRPWSSRLRLRADLQLQHAFTGGYNDWVGSVGFVLPLGPVVQVPSRP